MEIAAAAGVAAVAANTPKLKGLAIQHAHAFSDFLGLERHLARLVVEAQNGLNDAKTLGGHVKTGLLGGLNPVDKAALGHLQTDLQNVVVQIQTIEGDINTIKSKHAEELRQMQHAHAHAVLDKPPPGIFGWTGRWS